MKAAVANINNKHFYVYVRKHFTDIFLHVNDDAIKEADIYDINNDKIHFKMYYIFEQNEKTDKLDDIIDTEHVDLTEEMVTVLKEILHKSEKGEEKESEMQNICLQKIKLDVGRYPSYVGERVRDIVPRVRIHKLLPVNEDKSRKRKRRSESEEEEEM